MFVADVIWNRLGNSGHLRGESIHAAAGAKRDSPRAVSDRPNLPLQCASRSCAGSEILEQWSIEIFSWNHYPAGSLSDLHETLLDELGCSRHCIRIHLDAGEKVGVSPVVNLCGRATQLDSHTALLQLSNEFGAPS